jgi:hypothetical protein
MIEDALFTHLSADAGVSALVVARIYPMLAPESPTYPFIVYHAISETVPYAMGGPGSTDVVRRRYQFDCYGVDPTTARKVAAAVTTALDRFSGTVIYTGGSTMIQDVYRQGINDIFDFEARKFKRAVDLEIIYVE